MPSEQQLFKTEVRLKADRGWHHDHAACKRKVLGPNFESPLLTAFLAPSTILPGLVYSTTIASSEVLIRIDAAVAQERPVAPRAFDLAEVAFDYQRLLGARPCLTDNFPERISDE